MFEPLCAAIERFVISEGKFGVHLFDFCLNSVVKVGIVHGRRGGFFLLFEVDYFNFLPKLSFGVVALDLLVVGSWARLEFLLFWLKNHPFLFRERIGCLLPEEGLVKLVGYAEIGPVFSWARVGVFDLEYTLFFYDFTTIVFFERHAAYGVH